MGAPRIDPEPAARRHLPAAAGAAGRNPEGWRGCSRSRHRALRGRGEPAAPLGVLDRRGPHEACFAGWLLHPASGVALRGLLTAFASRIGSKASWPSMVLQAAWDPTFSEASYGFRPGRSAHQAVARAQEHIADGYGWVVDLDLEKVPCGASGSLRTRWDRVNQVILMGLPPGPAGPVPFRGRSSGGDRSDLRRRRRQEAPEAKSKASWPLMAKRVTDPPILKLIRGYLTAGVLVDGPPRPAGRVPFRNRIGGPPGRRWSDRRTRDPRPAGLWGPPRNARGGPTGKAVRFRPCCRT